MTRTNEHGQPIGRRVEWSARPPVAPVTLVGQWSRVEPVAAHHLDALYDALVLRSPESIWTYLAVGPFTAPAGLNVWLRELNDDPVLALTLDDRFGDAELIHAFAQHFDGLGEGALNVHFVRDGLGHSHFVGDNLSCLKVISTHLDQEGGAALEVDA